MLVVWKLNPVFRSLVCTEWMASSLTGTMGHVLLCSPKTMESGIPDVLLKHVVSAVIGIDLRHLLHCIELFV